MTMTATMDEIEERTQEKPGARLASVRQQKGYSIEYVAGKLHLRVQIIELLEADEYQNMPEPVFIKGYLRAYAKLLEIPGEPLLETFKSLYSPERKPERALWQSKRETNRAERVVRWLTALFAIGVVTAVAIWWNKNKDDERIFPSASTAVRQETAANKSESEIRLTDLSKMRSLLSSHNLYSAVEKQGE
ncbi:MULTISPECIES: helix-turn-helix domain-containing protein [Legionella]|uniref:helix-turn-helix domain-containing protein n=1 Tax=Legionella TaxID=445 RepID=UPI000F8CF4F9|nr:helix-turn-helix domain-containing protein [Legionella septentrionalis]RUQ95075.1 helix-turn-helix domain-containing protein [Legionella septentrionalis]RUR09461.1 helix-turn-helix domain-containing protein [Legionella septentrionalis]RUR13707.1 helix-turn-helix domain-containing protein [Legionella septentrionalis]